MQNRKVYKQDGKEEYVYYHDWGHGLGENWMIGKTPGSSNRGVESVNLEARALDAQWCPESVNKSKFPWRVFNSRGQWMADTRLRVRHKRLTYLYPASKKIHLPKSQSIV